MSYTEHHETTKQMTFVELIQELQQLPIRGDISGLTEYNIETARSMLAMAWTFRDRANADNANLVNYDN